MKSIYDEAIETFHDMHPEYDTANGGTHRLHDKVLNALKRAKKVEELLELYREYFQIVERGDNDWHYRMNEIPEQIKALEEEMK